MPSDEVLLHYIFAPGVCQQLFYISSIPIQKTGIRLTHAEWYELYLASGKKLP